MRAVHVIEISLLLHVYKKYFYGVHSLLNYEFKDVQKLG